MSKKPSRHPQAKPAADLTEETLMTAMTEAQRAGVSPKPEPSLTSVLLREVRAAALKLSSDTAHNIAELESWRNEIDATIAFLKAQRK